MERRDFLRKSALAALGTAVGGTGLVQAFKHIDNGNKNTNRMKITVLTGSPEEKGHEVFRFDCAFKNVGPCRACNRCGMDGPCIIDDDFSELRPHLVEADMVVFATPMYYFGISAQMKRVIDRFYAINGQIKGAPKKAAFMLTFADTAKEEAEPMLLHYRTLMKYLGWTSVGEIVAPGVWTAGAVNDTDFPRQAYELGKSL